MLTKLWEGKLRAAGESTRLSASAGLLWLDLQLQIMLNRWKRRDRECLHASWDKVPARTHFCLNKMSMLAWPWEVELLSTNLDSEHEKGEKQSNKRILLFANLHFCCCRRRSRRAHECYFALENEKNEYLMWVNRSLLVIFCCSNLRHE